MWEKIATSIPANRLPVIYRRVRVASQRKGLSYRQKMTFRLVQASIAEAMVQGFDLLARVQILEAAAGKKPGSWTGNGSPSVLKWSLTSPKSGLRQAWTNLHPDWSIPNSGLVPLILKSIQSMLSKNPFVDEMDVLTELIVGGTKGKQPIFSSVGKGILNDTAAFEKIKSGVGKPKNFARLAIVAARNHAIDYIRKSKRFYEVKDEVKDQLETDKKMNMSLFQETDLKGKIMEMAAAPRSRHGKVIRNWLREKFNDNLSTGDAEIMNQYLDVIEARKVSDFSKLTDDVMAKAIGKARPAISRAKANARKIPLDSLLRRDPGVMKAVLDYLEIQDAQGFRNSPMPIPIREESKRAKQKSAVLNPRRSKKDWLNAVVQFQSRKASSSNRARINTYKVLRGAGHSARVATFASRMASKRWTGPTGG